MLQPTMNLFGMLKPTSVFGVVDINKQIRSTTNMKDNNKKNLHSGWYPLLSGVRFTNKLVTRIDLGSYFFSKFNNFTIVRPVSIISSTMSTFYKTITTTKLKLIVTIM